MKLAIIHNITFNTEEKIHATTLSKPDELIILFKTGNVVRFNLKTKEQEHLFHMI